MKRDFKMKYKPFFIIFKGLLLKQIKQFFLEYQSSIVRLQNVTGDIAPQTSRHLPTQS